MPLNPGHSAFELSISGDAFPSSGPGYQAVPAANDASEAAEERSARSRANAKLAAISRKYWDSIPVPEINQALTSSGLGPMEGGIFTGREGRSSEKVGPRTHIALQWHKMEATGRWEINAYVT